MLTALVTGSSYGLGKYICEKLLTEGYKVYGVSRTHTDIEHPNFTEIKADLLNPKEIESIPNLINNIKIDLLVNNAGMTVQKDALNFTKEDFDKLFGLNFVAPIKLTASIFKDAPKGLVINISSNSDRYPDPQWAMYGSTKAALNLYFDTIAVENPDLKIISMLPSYIDTPLLRKSDFIETGFTFDRCMKPEDVADFVAEVAKNNDHLESGARIIVVSEKLKDGVQNPEKLWVYNVDTKKLQKVNN